MASTTARSRNSTSTATAFFIFKEAVTGILAPVAKQERVRLSDITIAGLQCARAQGGVGGRPKAEESDPELAAMIARLRAEGKSIRAVAAGVKKSPNTGLRLLLPKRESSSTTHSPTSVRS